MCQQLSNDQVYADIIRKINNADSQYFIITGSCGTGKSFLCSKLRSTLKKFHSICPTNYLCEMVGGMTIYRYTHSKPDMLKVKQFKQKIVFIEEVFLFKYEEMQCLLKCCQEDTVIIMSGDQFQIPQISKNYFYEAFSKQQLSTLVHYNLTKYYRADDLQLQQILRRFIQKPFNVDLFQLPIQKANKQKLLDLVINHNYTVITGTHRRIQQIMNTVNNSIKERLFTGGDNKQYYIGQKVFLTNDFGSITQQGTIYFHDNMSQMISVADDKMNMTHLMINTTIDKSYFDQQTQKYVKNIVNVPPYYKFMLGNICTSHIIQGRTLNGVVIDVSDLFASGAVYMSIGRCKRLENVYIYGKVVEGQYVSVPDGNNMFVKMVVEQGEPSEQPCEQSSEQSCEPSEQSESASQ